MNIALMCHNRKQELMVQFCTAYCGVLSKHTVCATNTTGKMVAEATGLPLTNADIKEAVDNGEGDELHVMLGIVETDEKWWNDIDAVTAAWQPYWVEAGYEGELVCYPF